MKIIVNKYIPFKGFLAMTVYPFIFVRKDLEYHYDTEVHRHECIHARQQIEMLWVGFFLWYAIEYLLRIICGASISEAYHHISFEREAYLQERDPSYLSERPLWAWVSYIFM